MTNPDNVGGLPELPEPVGHVHSDYEYCAERPFKNDGWPVSVYEAHQVRAYGKLCRAAPAGGDDGAAEKWCICRSCMVIVRLPADTPLPGRCQCSPSSWSLTRLRIPKGYELRREASADVERCDSCDGTGLLHRADGMYVGECHCVYSAPAGSGEVLDSWQKWPIINRLQMQANDCEDAADMESDAVIMPLQLKALATDLREAAALLRKLQQGAE